MGTNSTTIKSRFSLSRKNQKGQVAIFVALIFQVVFVFFALMINVGLLIHHKINLQHSTDLAAYYGAMKQAEQLNAIAHINFQMRQAWKLMTWRYRILGTFGFIKAGSNTALQQDFAFESFPNTTNPPAPGKFNYWGSAGVHASKSSPYTNGYPTGGSPRLNCAQFAASNPDYIIDGMPVGIQDVPFFCVAHSGFHSWPQSETNCQLSCDMFNGARVINLIPNLQTQYQTVFGGNLADDVNNTINTVNVNIQNTCQKLGPFGATMLARFLAMYANESIARSETIKMLAANLSQDPEIFVDLDGKKIKDGARRTFQNNLTGANFAGLSGDDSFRILNGLNKDKCKFKGGGPNDGSEFLKRIEFQMLNFFLMNCTPNAAAIYGPTPVYVGTGLAAPFSQIPQSLQNVVASFLNENGRAMIGYEKNPHCEEYFAVKTYAEPTIPFLPLGKIKLEAVAVAKPFGGSVGPWYGTTWGLNDPKSQYDNSDPDTRMDPTLPMREYSFSGQNEMTKSVYTQPNFALFLGDRLGLRNLDYIAAFHSALAVRDINEYPGATYSSSENMLNELKNNGVWPDYDNWNGADDASGDFRKWDSLASSDAAKAGTRALEIAAIAPNQFDIYHYSIDPDFHHNYYKRIYKGFSEIKAAAGISVNVSPEQLRPDFGAYDVDDTSPYETPLSLKTFSVKDQILMKNIIFDKRPKQYGVSVPGSPPAGATGDTYNDFLNYLVSAQSSLLTGWTFLRFNNYFDFPGAAVNRTDNTMAFGQCDDPWNKTSAAIGGKTQPQNFETPMKFDSEYPPATGNCVTGGRTGYSVKIISPNQVLETEAASRILNGVDPSFFQF